MTPEAATAAAPAASAPASAPTPATAPSSPASSTAPASSAPASTGTSPAITSGAPAEIKPESFPNQEAYARALFQQEMEQIPKDGDEASAVATEDTAAVPAQDAQPAATDGAQADQQADKAAEGDDEYTFDLEEPAIAPGDPEAIAKLVTEKPEFGALLEKDPELKELLFDNARAAAEAKQFREFFPDVPSAKFAHENANAFIDVRDTFMTATTAEGTKATLEKIAQLAIERDEQGNPIIDPATGEPKIGDDFYGFLDNTRDMSLDFERDELKARLAANQYASPEAKEQDELAAAAFDVIKEYLGPKQTNAEDLPQELQARAQELDRRERELESRVRNEKVSERQQFETGLVQESQTRVTTAINHIFDSVVKQGAHLSPFLREVLPNKIGSELMKVVSKDPNLKAQMAELQRLPMSPDVRSRRLALLDKAVQTYLPNIAKAQFKAAGVQAIRNQKDKINKIDAQKNASRSEPKGSAAAASPNSQPLSEDAAFQKAEQTWQARNPGRPVDRDAMNQIALWSVRLQTGQPI